MTRKKTVQVRIIPTLARDAAVIAAASGMTLTGYLTQVLMEAIRRDWPKRIRPMTGTAEEARQ